MYKHTIEVTLDDELVHKYSIMEWEELLLGRSVIQRDELPLSYGRIAEILAEEYHKYGQPYFGAEYGSISSVKETTATKYTDDNGNTIDTRIPLGAKTPAALMSPPEESGLYIGIATYTGRPRRDWKL